MYCKKSKLKLLEDTDIIYSLTNSKREFELQYVYYKGIESAVQNSLLMATLK